MLWNECTLEATKSVAPSVQSYWDTWVSVMLNKVEIEWNEKPQSRIVDFSCIWLLLLHPFHGLFSGTTWVSWYKKGKTSLDLNEARDDGVLGWQWHQLDHMQTICTSLQIDNHTNTSLLNYYRLDALPDAQLTVSKHWRVKHWRISSYAMMWLCCNDNWAI